MGIWRFDYAFIQGSSSYADAREAITDDKGQFFISPARQIWFYPFSGLHLEDIYVYKPGYDSHPPRMQYIWSDIEKERWKEKIMKINPGYRFDRTIETNYTMVFRVIPNQIKPYKQTIIKLNSAITKEAQNNAKSGFTIGTFYCEIFKIRKFEKSVGRRRR